MTFYSLVAIYFFFSKITANLLVEAIFCRYCRILLLPCTFLWFSEVRVYFPQNFPPKFSPIITKTPQIPFQCGNDAFITLEFIMIVDYISHKSPIVSPLAPQSHHGHCLWNDDINQITITPHTRHGVSYCRKLDCVFNSLFRRTTKECSVLLDSWWEEFGERWIPLTDGQQCWRCFHVMTSSLLAVVTRNWIES